MRKLFLTTSFLLTLLSSINSMNLLANDTSSATLTNPSAQNMSAYADLVYSQGAYLLMVGEARFAWARAALYEAMAAHEWQRVRLLKEFVDRLHLELKNLRQEEYRLRQKGRQIEDYAVTLGVLNSGKTNQYIFQAYRFFVIRIIPPSVLAEVMKTEVEPFTTDEFVSNRKRDFPEFRGRNLGQLFTYLEKNDLSFEPFSPAHLIALGGLQKFADAAAERLQAIRETMDEIRRGTLSIWQLPGDPAAPRPMPGTGNGGNGGNGGVTVPVNPITIPPKPPSRPGDPDLPFSAVQPVPVPK